LSKDHFTYSDLQIYKIKTSDALLMHQSTFYSFAIVFGLVQERLCKTEDGRVEESTYVSLWWQEN
jgi:hypothetical protein